MSAPTGRRALLSVYDKTGIVELSRGRVARGWARGRCRRSLPFWTWRGGGPRS